MIRYVKICPRCGLANSELAEQCEHDNEFLGVIPATPYKEKPPAPETVLPDFPGRALYLEITGAGKCLEVRDGWVIGQAHPSSRAEIQLAEVPGVNYIHRQHCRFSFQDDQWRVLAIKQAAFTNPTFVNNRGLAPGESAVLRNGDRIALADTVLHARIVDL
jgi:hypothetical protein